MPDYSFDYENNDYLVICDSCMWGLFNINCL